MKMKTINIKYSFPDKETAMARLLALYSQAIMEGVNCLKIIHGYGSTGIGGSIKTACISCLQKWKREGKIKSFCRGENFSASNMEAYDILRFYPQLKKDSDYGKQNDGITIVLIR